MEAARTGEASQLQKERDGLGASSKVRGDSDLGGTTPHAMVGEVCPVAASRLEAGVAHLNLPLLCLPLPMAVEAKCFVNPNLAPLTARSNFEQASPRAPQRGTIQQE